MESTNIKLKNPRGKRTAITEEKKKDLASEVTKYPAVWNIADSSYMKRDVAVTCWDAVAEVVGMIGNNKSTNN
jgi:hypothetical protein